MRVLGLDVGEKTVGVAMSDALGIAANPLETISRSQHDRKDVERVNALICEFSISVVVVGWPLELSGEEGRGIRKVRTFLEQLQGAISGVTWVKWDERFSTVAVERVLIDADLSRKRRKKVVDRQAAAYILQGWLDAQDAKK